MFFLNLAREFLSLGLAGDVVNCYVRSLRSELETYDLA
jgi:hypothetical protein